MTMSFSTYKMLRRLQTLMYTWEPHYPSQCRLLYSTQPRIRMMMMLCLHSILSFCIKDVVWRVAKYLVNTLKNYPADWHNYLRMNEVFKIVIPCHSSVTNEWHGYEMCYNATWMMNGNTEITGSRKNFWKHAISKNDITTGVKLYSNVRDHFLSLEIWLIKGKSKINIKFEHIKHRNIKF